MLSLLLCSGVCHHTMTGLFKDFICKYYIYFQTLICYWFSCEWEFLSRSWLRMGTNCCYTLFETILKSSQAHAKPQILDANFRILLSLRWHRIRENLPFPQVTKAKNPFKCYCAPFVCDLTLLRFPCVWHTNKLVDSSRLVPISTPTFAIPSLNALPYSERNQPWLSGTERSEIFLCFSPGR